MASASSPRMRFFAPPLKYGSWRGQILVGMLLLAACVVGAWRSSALNSGAIPLVGAVALLVWLWHTHLRKAGCPEVVGALAALFACWELSCLIAPKGSGELLAGGVFVYLVIWTFCAYEREPGLQPLATLAILISAGMLATPTIAIACAVLGISFFVHNRRHAIGGLLGFALLLFTPLMLCCAAIALLGFLRAETIFAQPFAVTVKMVSHISLRQLAAQTGINLLSMVRGLLFLLAVMAIRIGTRREGAPDLALVLVLLVVAVLHATRSVASDVLSIPVLSLAGACALLTQACLPKPQLATQQRASRDN